MCRDCLYPPRWFLFRSPEAFPLGCSQFPAQPQWSQFFPSLVGFCLTALSLCLIQHDQLRAVFRRLLTSAAKDATLAPPTAEDTKRAAPKTTAVSCLLVFLTLYFLLFIEMQQFPVFFATIMHLLHKWTNFRSFSLLFAQIKFVLIVSLCFILPVFYFLFYNNKGKTAQFQPFICPRHN